jgi:type IV pilus assembly protein PilN
MIRINLLPVRISKKKEAGKQQLVLFALAAAFALICNFGWSRSRSEDLASRQSKLARTKADIAQLDKIIGEVKNIKAEQAAVKDKLAVLEKLKAGRQGPVHMLDELASAVPKRVWIRRFEEKGGVATIEGSAGTIDDVSALLTALKNGRYFSLPDLKKTAAKSDGKFKVVDFTMTANINYTPADPLVAAVAGTLAAAKR